MTMNKEHQELRKLVVELYNEGYMAGISNQKWFDAFALAAQKIVSGEVFSEDLVIKCYDELFNKEVKK